jgi:uncharacterized membrane protein YoaK (UPF0700 family)
VDISAPKPGIAARLQPLEYVLAWTAFVAGSVDIISFAKLGGVFASAMTGNLAFLGLYSAAGRWYSAVGSLLALLGFVIGGSAGTLLSRNRQNHQAITVLIGAETTFLLGAALLWFAVSHRNGRLSTDGLILILSIAMGLQSIVGKKINLSNIPTVVFTSTLTNIVIAVTDSLARGKTAFPTDTKRQLASFWLYFLGAFIAGLFVFFHFGIVIFLPFAAAASALYFHIGGARAV